MLVGATVMSLRRSMSVEEEEHKRRLRRKFGSNVTFNNALISCGILYAKAL